MSDTNWTAIRAEYEQGATLRVLAVKHGVGKSTIAERKHKEQWTERRTNRTDTRTDIPLPPQRPLQMPAPGDALSIARLGLRQLAQYMTNAEALAIADHKSLSDALTQYLKVVMTAPREQDAPDELAIRLEKLLPSTRMEIRRLLVEDAQRQQQERTG